MAKYGTNSHQVEQFVRRLRNLTDVQWTSVLENAVKCAAAFGNFDRLAVELELYRAYGVNGANKMLASAMRESDLSRTTSEKRALVTMAIMALMTPTSMFSGQFAAAYGPFSGVIPLSDLGSGDAPQIDSPPDLPLGRFVLRLQDFPHQDAVVRIASALETSVGADTVRKAVGDALAIADADVVEHTGAAIDSLMASEVEELTELFATTMGRTGVSAERVANQSCFYASRREPFGNAARRAALGLAARESISPATFALLYLPFEGFIPAESLG